MGKAGKERGDKGSQKGTYGAKKSFQKAPK